VYARSTTVLAKRESIDAGIGHIREVALPALQRMHGFIGLSLLVDRDSGLRRDQLVGIQGRDAGTRRAGRRDS
jgi:hypothetical protein